MTPTFAPTFSPIDGGILDGGGLGTDDGPAVNFPPVTGDQDAITGLSTRLDGIEQAFQGHATTVQATAECVAPSWQGEAATAYLTLSSFVTAHFHSAAETARQAKVALQSWAAELARCKRESMLAVSESEHWMQQVKTQKQALTSAENTISTAQQTLTDAQNTLPLLKAMGPLGHSMIPGVEASATSAQHTLGQARQAAQAARRALDQARQELSLWRARGRQAWEDAEIAAVAATRSLAPLYFTPPPLAGLPVAVPMLSPVPPFELPGGGDCDDGTIVSASSGETSKILGRLLKLSSVFPAAFTAILAAMLNAAEEDFDGEAGAVAGDGMENEVGIQGATDLGQAEQATAARLQAMYGDRLTDLEEDPGGGDYTGVLDGRRVTFDAYGDPAGAENWKPPEALASFGRHIIKDVDYTVVDLTGYNPAQIARIESWIDALTPEQQAHIIKIGF